MLGEPLADWIHPDDLERALEVTTLIAAGAFVETGITPAFYRVRRSDGTWIGLEVNGVQLGPPDGVLGWRQNVRQLTSASRTDHLTGAGSRSKGGGAGRHSLRRPRPLRAGQRRPRPSHRRRGAGRGGRPVTGGRAALRPGRALYRAKREGRGRWSLA